MYYEGKLKVTQTNEKTGKTKEITEQYIMDVDLFAEAEMTLMQQYNGDCDVFAIFRSKVREIVNEKEDDKPFFKATIVDVFTNDDGIEKELKYPVLVCAKDMADANKLMEEYLKEGMDMRLEKIERTKILDVL